MSYWRPPTSRPDQTRMRVIDGYTHIVPIGRGGLGDVYRATHCATGARVAIKVLRDVSDQSVAWHRTRRELAALAALAGHPHVIGLVDTFELDGHPGLVMEYAPGGSVAALMEHHPGTLSLGETVLIGRHVAAALVAAHRQGIVHRDIKPQNLLIDDFGRVKLCDFGIAALTRSDEFRTRTDAVSMRYASPEDLDDREIDSAADIYSLGATLLHLAHGAPPSLKQRLVPWLPPTDSTPEMAALDEVIAQCLQPTPSARPSAASVLAMLETCCAGHEAMVSALTVPAPLPVSADAQPLWADTDVERELAADTVCRRPPEFPMRPQPAGSASHRVGRLVATVLAVVVVGAVGGLLIGARRGDGGAARSPDPLPSPQTSGTTVSAQPSSSVPVSSVPVAVRTDDLDSLASVRWPFGDVGGCLVQVADKNELAAVDCDQPHDLQRFLVGTLPTDVSFDEPWVAAEVDRRCRAQFVSFVGVEYRLSALDIFATRPSAQSWASGHDRAFQCVLGVAHGRIVGDAAGMGW